MGGFSGATYLGSRIIKNQKYEVDKINQSKRVWDYVFQKGQK